ncbi:MAG: IMP dehydrogenase [Candidatus Firestonebacteria bacterium]
MAKEKFEKIGLTFDDVLLVPARAEYSHTAADVSTYLTRNIKLNIPLVSAAMDTVTEARLAIAIAQEGGIGIIHKNLTCKEQAEQVDKVKRFMSGIITHPITLSPDRHIKEASEIMLRKGISGFPVTEDGTVHGKLVGILTRRDLKFIRKMEGTVGDYMTRNNLVTAPEGISLVRALEILNKNKVEKLPVVDKTGHLKGLVTIRDIEKRLEYPASCKDKLGRLKVGAAVGTAKDTEERAAALVAAGVDVLSIDTAHGHSKNVIEVVKKLRKKYPGMDIIAGNVATEEAVKDLCRLGVDGIKVGMGPGSICTTRVIAGIGVPQITAVYECSKMAKKYKVPVIADGGIKYSGDITKALAAGASSVMIGNLFAGTDEAPGETVFLEGRRFKMYHGMGSLAAMKKGSKDRYFQDEVENQKLVPEGVEGRVPYRGSISNSVLQLIGGLKSGMGYCGAVSIKELQANAKFIRITPAGLQENHPHNITITSEPPNYWL